MCYKKQSPTAYVGKGGFMEGLFICLGISLVMFGASSVIVAFGLYQFFSN